jgi:hypothetical protein
MRCGSCKSLPDVTCLGAVVIYHVSNGNAIPLCFKSLDYWLDFADEDEDLEPVRLQWMYGPDSNYHGDLSRPGLLTAQVLARHAVA